MRINKNENLTWKCKQKCRRGSEKFDGQCDTDVFTSNNVDNLVSKQIIHFFELIIVVF